MEEVIKEFVTEVKLRKKEGEYHFMTKNLPYQVFFEADPLILLDGLPVSKPDDMVSFDPLKINKLEVVAHTYYTGPVANYGIISFTTYEGISSDLKLPPDAIVTDYPGYLFERTYYSPAYQTEQKKQNRLPDFRNVLDWESSVRTGIDGAQSVNFYTSDLPGNYLIVVEGISKDGLCGSATATITVK